MVYYLYLVSFLGAVTYIGFRLRKPDLLTITIIACGYYSSALLFGEIYDPDSKSYVDIHDFIYIFYSFLFSSLTIACFVNDHYLNKYFRNSKSMVLSEFLYFHLAILIVLFLAMNLLDSRAFFPDDVGEFSAASFGAIYNIYWVSALIFLITSFRSTSKFLKILGILFLLTTLLAGSRAYFTAGCFALLLLYFQAKPPMRLLASFSRLIIIIFGFLFLLVFKNIYQYLLFLDYEMVLAAGSDVDLILFRLTKGSEAIILLNFQHAITLYENGRGPFFDLILVKSIPFLSELYIEGLNLDPRTFSDLIDDKYYQSVNYGMASSLWGLVYYVMGPLGCIMFGFTYICIILYLNIRIKKSDLISIHLIPASVFMAFYASRVEIGAVLFPFYMSCFMLFTWILIRSIFRRRHAINYG